MLKLTLEPEDIFALYKAYMPFVKGGGLFVKTEQKAEIGSDIHLTFRPPNKGSTYQFVTKVVWISPQKTLFEDSFSGIGVVITGPDATKIHHAIDTLVVDLINSEQPTDTM